MTEAAVGRTGGRGTGRRLLASALVLAAMGSVYWWGPALLRHARYFDVRGVDVVGAKYLEPAAVARALEAKLGPSPSVWAPLGSMEAALERMPGVASAHVSRSLPGTLVVRIEEKEPVALAGGPAGLVAVDEDAQPLAYDAGQVDAPLVRRPDARLTRALAQIAVTDAGLFADIAAADLDGGIELVLKSGAAGRIRLAEPVTAEQVRAIGVVRRELAARSLAWRELDGRFAGLVVVRPVHASPAAEGRRA